MDEANRTVRRLELAAKTLSVAYALISIIWLVWIMIPEHQRKLMIMQAMAATRKNAGRLASRTAHQAMGQELTSGIENYLLPYGCSRVAEWAAGVYERARYS